jgi:hypothetical protein
MNDKQWHIKRFANNQIICKTSSEHRVSKGPTNRLNSSMVWVISKKLANGKYLKGKTIVDKVHDKYTAAKVKVLDSSLNAKDGDNTLQLCQDNQATAIPK